MKFMAEWYIKPEHFPAVLERFKEGTEPTDGFKSLGRYHQVGTGRGFRLIETDDPVSITKNNLYWADLIEIKVVPVVEDDQIAKALGD